MQPRKEKVAVIKESYVAITGDYIKAILLHQLVYWTFRVHDFDEYIKEETERLRQNGINVLSEPLLTHGWIYKSAEELSNETMLGLAPHTIRKYLEELIKMGYLVKRNNPLIKYDRTYQYRVNLIKVHQDIVSKGYSSGIILEHPTSKNDFSNTQDGVLISRNGGAIPETIYRDIKYIINNIGESSENKTEVGNQYSKSVSKLDIKEQINEDVRYWTGRPTPLPMGELSQLEELYNHYGRDKVFEAMKKAREQNKWSIAYLKGILDGKGRKKRKYDIFDRSKEALMSKSYDYEGGIKYEDYIKMKERGEI